MSQRRDYSDSSFWGRRFEKKKNKQKDQHWFSLWQCKSLNAGIHRHRHQRRCKTLPVLSAVAPKLQDLHLPLKREENVENVFKFCENKNIIKFLHLPFVQWAWSCPACPYFAFSFVMHYQCITFWILVVHLLPYTIHSFWKSIQTNTIMPNKQMDFLSKVSS